MLAVLAAGRTVLALQACHLHLKAAVAEAARDVGLAVAAGLAAEEGVRGHCVTVSESRACLGDTTDFNFIGNKKGAGIFSFGLYNT